MTPEQKAAYVISQSVCAMIEAIGAHAENMQRAAQGYGMAYDEAAIVAIIEKYGIYHNAVHAYTHT